MFSEESDKVEKYVGGLPDMIHGSVVASKPKTMQEAIEIATELMDKKVHTFAERETASKRKLENTSRTTRNQQQQQYSNKRQNTSRVYTAVLSYLIPNALQTLLPQIRAEIREEFRTSSEPSDAGGNPPPTTIHAWLERFNKQKPHSFEKVTVPVDAENWISHMEKIFDVMGCEDAFKTRLVVYK
nr:hypothetical protein [Tanacetum cinerariifolium]